MIPFSKVHGIGNDFVLIDGIANDLSQVDLPNLAVQICNRKFGVGADGLLILGHGENAPFQMVMFNPDGTLSEMCGNGIRCIAKKIRDIGYSKEVLIQCETGAGTLDLEFIDDVLVRVDMGQISFESEKIGIADRSQPFIDQVLEAGGREWIGTAVSVGNPHIVFFVEDLSQIDLESLGPTIENHYFFPNRVNVHFAQVVTRNSIVQRTWERGAGLTLACGTGACAVTAAAWRTGRSERKVTLELPGGKLHIEIDEAGHVFMTGPAETAFEGVWVAKPQASI